MKNLKFYKIILTILVFLTVLSIGMAVRAEDDPVVILPNSVDANENVETNNPANNILDTNTNTNNTNVNNAINETKHPEAGLEDYTVLFVLVAVFVAIAMYAYKKVNDYKNI